MYQSPISFDEPWENQFIVLYDFITYKMQEGACHIALLGVFSNLAP